MPARLLLDSATVNGARALGFDADFGTIEPGKRDRLIAVELDGSVSNVEEYLVSGIDRVADQLARCVMTATLSEYGPADAVCS